MTWLDRYHEDHKSVLLLLAKLEGNLTEMEKGQTRPNIMLEFEEFGDVIKQVIIPHFKAEEEDAYPKLVKLNPAAAQFVDNMLEDHRKLHKAFKEYLAALGPANQDKLIKSGKIMLQLLMKHIEKEENALPELLKRAQKKPQ